MSFIERNSDKRPVIGLFAVLLLCTILTHTIRIPIIVGYLSVAAPTAGIGFWLLRNPYYCRNIEVTTLILLSLIWVGFIGGFFIHPGAWSLIRTIVFIGFSFLVICIIPIVVPQQNFEYIVSRVAAALCLIAIIVWATNSYVALAGYHPGWYWPTTLPYIGELIPIVGILDTPNLMGAVCVVGAFLSTAHYYRTHLKTSLGVSSLLSIGVFLSVSRTALLAFAAGVCVLITFNLGNRRAMALCAVGGISSLLLFLMGVFGLIPAPEQIVSIRFTGRVELWHATWRAFLDSPFVGWGAVDTKELIQPYITSPRAKGRGIHNSYLRMFVMTGTIGGISYLVLTVIAGIRSGYAARTPAQATIFALYVSTVIMQIFNAGTIFGFGFRSFLYALVTAYALAAYRNSLPERAKTQNTTARKTTRL